MNQLKVPAILIGQDERKGKQSTELLDCVNSELSTGILRTAIKWKNLSIQVERAGSK